MTTVHRARPAARTWWSARARRRACWTARTDRLLLDAAAELAADGLRVLAVASRPPTRRRIPGRRSGSARRSGLVGIGDPLRGNARDTVAAFEARRRAARADHRRPPRHRRRDRRPARHPGPGDRVVRGDAGPLTADDSTTPGCSPVRSRSRSSTSSRAAGARPRRRDDRRRGQRRAGAAPRRHRRRHGRRHRGGPPGRRPGAGRRQPGHRGGRDRGGPPDLRQHPPLPALRPVRRRWPRSLVMLAGPFLGLPLPLLPAQILWINLLTHGVPGVALGAEPAEPDVLRRPPRSPQESVLGDGLLRSGPGRRPVHRRRRARRRRGGARSWAGRGSPWCSWCWDSRSSVWRWPYGPAGARHRAATGHCSALSRCPPCCRSPGCCWRRCRALLGTESADRRRTARLRGDRRAPGSRVAPAAPLMAGGSAGTGESREHGRRRGSVRSARQAGGPGETGLDALPHSHRPA